MRFSEIYSEVIQLWPSEIDTSDGYPIGKDGFYSERLSDVWDKVEEEVGYKNPWTELMVWAMYKAFHTEARCLLENGASILEPKTVSLNVIESYYHEELTWKDSTFKELLNSYFNDLN